MRSAFEGVSMGFLAPWRGWLLIRENSKIRRLVILPFLVSAVCVVAGVAALLTSGQPVIAGVTSLIASWVGIAQVGASSGWAGFVVGLIGFLVWPLALAFTVLFAFIVAKVLAAPLFALLAERTLIELAVLKEQPFRLIPWLRLNLRMIAISMLKALVFAILGLSLFVISLLPVVGLIASFGILLIAAFDVVDASFEALQMGARERVRFFAANFSVFFGLAACMGLVFLIPGLNFLILPVAIVGAGDLMRRLV